MYKIDYVPPCWVFMTIQIRFRRFLTSILISATVLIQYIDI